MKVRPLFLAVLISGFVINACGGSGTLPSGSSGALGSFSYSIVGAAQPPVTASASNGANVTAIAGGLFDRLTFTMQGPSTLYETRIAYVSNVPSDDREIFTMRYDGTDIQQLTNNAFDEGTPVYSPDGSKIAFHTDRDGNFEIYVMNSNGTSPVRLTNDGEADLKPTWSPDGAYIAFASYRDGNYNIYRMNANGGDVLQLTASSSTDYEPSWSPDGTFITFYSDRDGNPEIYKMRPDGVNEVRLTNNAVSDSFASVSHDGKKILFISHRDGNSNVYTMNIDGLSPTAFNSDESADTDPRYSPDGKKIIWVSNRTSRNRIFSANLDGSDLKRYGDLLTAIDYVNPGWSPFYSRSPRALIGVGAPLGTAAAGFLFGQEGNQITSVVTFDTTTTGSRSGAQVTTQSASSNDNGSNLIFSVTTTAGLSSVRFASVNEGGNLGPVLTPTIPAGSTGALISFESKTGLVSSVLPYTVNRGGGVDTKLVGNEVHISKSFTGVFNGKGNNLAPNGANSVVIDRTTGELVRIVKN